MAFSPDVIVTALQELLPGFNETFTKFHPAFDNIIKKGNRRVAEGPYIEFALCPDGPGFPTPVINGNEVIAGGRKQNSVRGNEYAATIIYAYDVPGADLREANGKYDLVDLIKRYPERSLLEFHEMVARQLVMGGVPGMTNFITLNGDTTYDPKGLGARRGVFQFAAPAAQNHTVHGVQKNSIEGWYNQYTHILSFRDNGRAFMREAYYDAAQEGATGDGEPDMIFADRGSHDAYLTDLDDQVQIVERTTRDGDRAVGRFRRGVKFLDAVVYPEFYIVPASFTSANAQEGLMYGLTSATWKLFTMGRSADMETKGFFDSRGPIRLPTQDMWRYEYVLSMGAFCDDLRKNFVVTGGNNP